MSINELLEQAIEKDFIDLQALIMFLVFEKQVLSLQDDTKELDLYFLEKHQERMNKELHAYKKKMQLKEKPSVWRVYTAQGETLYVYTENELQARTYAISLKYEPLKVVYVPNNTLMTVDGMNIEVGKLIEGKKTPSLLGTNGIEQKYEEWKK